MTPTGHPAPGTRHPARFDISSPDAPRARRFYQEMFGWPVNLLDETYVLVSGEGGQPAGSARLVLAALHRDRRLFPGRRHR